MPEFSPLVQTRQLISKVVHDVLHIVRHFLNRVEKPLLCKTDIISVKSSHLPVCPYYTAWHYLTYGLKHTQAYRTPYSPYFICFIIITDCSIYRYISRKSKLREHEKLLGPSLLFHFPPFPFLSLFFPYALFLFSPLSFPPLSWPFLLLDPYPWK